MSSMYDSMYILTILQIWLCQRANNSFHVLVDITVVYYLFKSRIHKWGFVDEKEINSCKCKIKISNRGCTINKDKT